jgi:hypothetical protein
MLMSLERVWQKGKEQIRLRTGVRAIKSRCPIYLDVYRMVDGVRPLCLEIPDNIIPGNITLEMDDDYALDLCLALLAQIRKKNLTFFTAEGAENLYKSAIDMKEHARRANLTSKTIVVDRAAGPALNSCSTHEEQEQRFRNELEELRG